MKHNRLRLTQAVKPLLFDGSLDGTFLSEWADNLIMFIDLNYYLYTTGCSQFMLISFSQRYGSLSIGLFTN
jgi:hypothetical protein